MHNDTYWPHGSGQVETYLLLSQELLKLLSLWCIESRQLHPSRQQCSRLAGCRPACSKACLGLLSQSWCLRLLLPWLLHLLWSRLHLLLGGRLQSRPAWCCCPATLHGSLALMQQHHQLLGRYAPPSGSLRQRGHGSRAELQLWRELGGLQGQLLLLRLLQLQGKLLLGLRGLQRQLPGRQRQLQSLLLCRLLQLKRLILQLPGPLLHGQPCIHGLLACQHLLRAWQSLAALLLRQQHDVQGTDTTRSCQLQGATGGQQRLHGHSTLQLRLLHHELPAER